MHQILSGAPFGAFNSVPYGSLTLEFTALTLRAQRIAVIKIFNKQSNELLGRISEADLQFLADHLEEESIHDTDYYIVRETVDQFSEQGASPKLVDLLRGGLRDGNAIEIRWERDTPASNS